MKLTKIFPVSDEIVKIAENYENIIFFEEGIKNGGIAEHFVSLMCNFHGNYKIIAVEGFVKQASVNRQLEVFGLSKEKMIETINGVING